MLEILHFYTHLLIKNHEPFLLNGYFCTSYFYILYICYTNTNNFSVYRLQSVMDSSLSFLMMLP